MNDDLRGKTALVTGASSGLGAAFARDLARRGCNLILVARREDLLRRLQGEIAGSSGPDVRVLALDLGEPDAPQQLFERVQSTGKGVDVLVNNAGYGVFGDFVEIPWERQSAMLELDIVALTHLTKLFVNPMVERGFGYILQVASIGAYQPSPTYAMYSAAKSYVLSFGEALRYELRGTGVHCTVTSPGVVATEFRDVAGQRTTLYQRLVMMQSADVVRVSVDAMLKGRATVIPGWLNALTVWSNRFVPHRISIPLTHRLMTIT